MRIDPESGGGIDWDSDGKPEERLDRAPSAPYADVPAIVRAAMQGALPGLRPLKQGEPEKLSPLHIQMILDRASGYKPGEIAQKYDIGPVRVSQILNHPAAELILGAIAARLADRITDPVERMKGYAHECITTKVEIMRDPASPKALRNTVASDLLDRAGYGARQKLDVSKVPAPQEAPLNEETARRLAEGLERAREVRTMDYSRYTRTGEEGGREVNPPAAEGFGAPEQRLGASPEGPSPTLRIEAA